MATSDFLFQNTAPSSFTSTIENRSDMPDWYQAARRQLISRASQIAGEPYQQYSGPRVAALNNDQLSAYNKTRSVVDAGNPYSTQAAGMIQQGGAGFDQTAFDKYLSPYTGRMMDELSRQGLRNLNETLLPAVNDTFTGAGMFGSSRFGDFNLRALRDTQESILGEQSKALSSAYDSAMSAYGQGQDRTLNAGQQLGTLGQLLFNQGITGASALEAIGNTQQTQQQRSYDTAYQDFIDQRDAPLKSLETLSGVINSYTPDPPKATATTSPITQTNYQPSPLAQILGTLGSNQG